MTIYNTRRWHYWISAVLAIPCLIVGITAIFIAHDKEWGLKNIPVNASWLPGYHIEQRYAEGPELRSMTMHQGSTYVGLKNGLFRLENGSAQAISALQGIHVHDLHSGPGGLMAATKYGVWTDAGGQWQQVLKGEAWHLSEIDGQIGVIIKDTGLMLSSDAGKSWHAAPALNSVLAGLPAEHKASSLTLSKLMMDLHTGKAFLGKPYEWIWIDLVGAVIAFLTLSGIYLWWRGRRQQARMAL